MLSWSRSRVTTAFVTDLLDMADPPDAGARLRQHGGHLQVPTHGVPGAAVKSACLLTYGNGLARRTGWHPTRQALKNELTTTWTHMASPPPNRGRMLSGIGSTRADAGEFDVPEGRANLDRMIPDVTTTAGWETASSSPPPSVGSRLRPGPRRRHLRYFEDVSGRLRGVPGRDPRLRASRLSGAVLRQISGGNNLTAARKFKGENVFKFHGMLMICATGFGGPTRSGRAIRTDPNPHRSNPTERKKTPGALANPACVKGAQVQDSCFPPEAGACILVAWV